MRTLIRLLAEWIARSLEAGWRRREDRALETADFDSGSHVRVSNLNYGLVPFGVAILLAGLDVFLVLYCSERELRSTWGFLAALGGLALIAFVVGSYRILWVDLDQVITFRRLFKSKRYSLDELREWGFEIARGRYSHAAPLSDSMLRLSMSDGTRFEVIVSPAKAARIAALMELVTAQSA